MTTSSNVNAPNLIFGRVTNQQNEPLANLLVQALDRDLRSEQLLGGSITDREGKFEIRWAKPAYKDLRKKGPDISIKVWSKEKKQLLYETSVDLVRFNASHLEEFNVIVRKAIV